VTHDGSPDGPTPRSYAVVGLGAIGGYYGARLLAAGHPVHFVARSDLEHVRERGLHVESPDGDLAFPDVSVFGSTADVPPVDVVLLAVKTTEVDAAQRLLEPLVGDDTIVVAMQNGLGVEAPIAEAVPTARVLGGMCFVCTNKVGPGHVRHLDYGAVTLGEHTDEPGGAGITAAVDAVASDLEHAGITASRVEDLVTGRWRKLVWNIPYNGLSVALDAGTDELMRDPVTRALVAELMREVVRAAEVCGHRIEPDFVDYMMRTTDKMTPYKTSMKLDYEAGRPLELDTIYGAPIAAARAAGFNMTRTGMLHAQLQFLDARNRGVDLDLRPRPG
jgi:2-dehydropantoate 2-reductase